MIISAWWNPASSKLKKSEAKFNRKTWKQKQLLSEYGFVLSMAPPPLSCDRRIKMKKIIIKQFCFLSVVLQSTLPLFSRMPRKVTQLYVITSNCLAN